MALEVEAEATLRRHIIITVIGIIASAIPQMVILWFWYKLESFHRGLVQVMTRLSEEKA